MQPSSRGILRVWVVKFQFRRRLISWENCTRYDLRGVIRVASMRPIYLLRDSSSSTFLFRGWVKPDLFLLEFLKMLPFVSFPFYPYQEVFRKCKAGAKNRQQSGFPRPESPTPRGAVFYTGMLFSERLTTTCFMTCCYCHAIDIRYLLFSWLSIFWKGHSRVYSSFVITNFPISKTQITIRCEKLC